MSRIILVLLVIGLQSVANAYSDEAISDAESVLESVKERFGAGEVHRVEVWEATKFVLDMKYEAKKHEKTAYCQEVQELAEKIATHTSVGYESGIRSISDVIRARTERWRLAEFCR